MKKVLAFSVLIMAAAMLVWRAAGPWPDTAAQPSAVHDDVSNRQKGTGTTIPASITANPAAQGLALARIEDAAQRDAALAAWIQSFDTHEGIVELISELRKAPGSTASLRALIAPHLTRQWATVDAPACINAFLSDGALFRRDPLDSGSNPFSSHPPETGAPAADLFGIIAETNPGAFRTWFNSAPADLIPSLLGDVNSPTWRAWAAADKSGDRVIRGMDPVLAQNFTETSFANLMAIHHPEVLLRPAMDNHDLGLSSRYYSGLLEKLSHEDPFSTSLIKAYTPDQLWDVFSKVASLSPGLDHGSTAAYQKLARLELAVHSGDVSSAAAAAGNLPAAHRQAATFTALLDSLDASAGESYWTDVNAIARAVNDSAANADTVEEITLINAYAELRGRIAGALAKESLPEALDWAGSIRDPRNRASCLMQIAAGELKPGIRAWASGASLTEVADEAIIMHIQDTTVSPPLVRQFSLPAAAGESVPEYYARLRATFQHHLNSNSTGGAPWTAPIR